MVDTSMLEKVILDYERDIKEIGQAYKRIDKLHNASIKKDLQRIAIESVVDLSNKIKAFKQVIEDNKKEMKG